MASRYTCHVSKHIFCLRFLLNSVDWLDAQDKEKVNQKVEHIKFFPGMPSWITDDNRLNALTNNSHFVTQNNDEPSPDLEAGAWYDSRINSIGMQLGRYICNFTAEIPFASSTFLSAFYVAHALIF